MSEFPRVAVMERRMLTAESETDCCLNSPTQTKEHSDPSNVSVCVSFPVIFVIAVILLSFYPFVRYPQLQRGIFCFNSTL